MNECWLLAAQEAPGWMHKWLDVTQSWELWWLGLGLLGQAIFTLRWIVQFVASERRGESVVPVAFWWSSLIGATMLLIYFIGRRDLVGVLGNSIGWVVYGRNLYLIQVKRSENRQSPG